MSSPRCLTICLLLAPAALAGGCGSAESTSTHTTAGVAATATTGAPSGVGTQTAAQGTGATGAEQTSTTPAPPAKRATPTTKAPPSQTSAQAEIPIAAIPKVKFTPPKRKPKVTPQYSEGHIVKPLRPGLRNQFPLELQSRFITVWLAANGSGSSAECVIEKYEARNVAEGPALAELVGVQVAVLDHLQLNPRARRYARECHSGALK
jgi:hypothetical protein